MNEQIAPTASFVCIGNEVLAGEVQDINTKYLASQLVKNGIRLQETRIVPDDANVIANTVNDLRCRYNYVFTSGGIGPTHDDVTSDAIAKAFDVKLILSTELRNFVTSYYNIEFNDLKMKMAYIPSGARIILNKVQQSFGFAIEDVYVVTGTPSVFQTTIDGVIKDLKGGPILLSKSMSFHISEGCIAHILEEVSKVYTNVEIGSYPFLRMHVKGTDVVVRSVKSELVEKVCSIIVEKVDRVIDAIYTKPSA